MANNRKRLIARELRREIVHRIEDYWHWDWVVQVAPGNWISRAESEQNYIFGRMDIALKLLWNYRIAPKQLHLPDNIIDELGNWDDWGEYLTGTPTDETEAESKWSRRLYTN